MHAIVHIGASQYVVTPGQELVVPRLSTTDKTITFDQVLLVVDGDQVSVGTPTVSGVKLVAEVMGEEKGDKIRVLKFKAKSRYRRVRGFRAQTTRLKIISVGDKHADTPVATPKSRETKAKKASK